MILINNIIGNFHLADWILGSFRKRCFFLFDPHFRMAIAMGMMLFATVGHKT
jgi:hypothetical protein